MSVYGKEDEYHEICATLLHQLRQYMPEYDKRGIIPADYAQELVKKLMPLKHGKECPKSKWFVAPEMAQLLADAQRQFVVIMDKNNIRTSTTFVPLFGSFDTKSEPIVMLNCDNKHWMYAAIEASMYLPPMNPYLFSKREEAGSEVALQHLAKCNENWAKKVPPNVSKSTGSFTNIISV